jgi:hypothetical protein
LIAYAPQALRQIAALRQQYERLECIEPIRNLDAALAVAERTSERQLQELAADSYRNWQAVTKIHTKLRLNHRLIQ